MFWSYIANKLRQVTKSDIPLTVLSFNLSGQNASHFMSLAGIHSLDLIGTCPRDTAVFAGCLRQMFHEDG